MLSLTQEEIKQKIHTLADEVCRTHGVDLIETIVKGHKNDVLIQMIVDKPSSGINIEDCAIINKFLAAVIAKDFLPPENFSLEVSSPGLDRPLVTLRDFARCKGKKLHFWLKEPVETPLMASLRGKKEAEGVLIDIGESALSIEVVRGQKLSIPLEIIIKGILVI